MKHLKMMALGLGWILSTGPFLCAADGGSPPLAVAQEPQKNDLGQTIFTLIAQQDNAAVGDFLDRFPTAIRDRALNRDYPLHAAINAGNQEVIATLLARGATLDGLDGRRATPLILCAKKKDLVTAAALLKATVPVDVKDMIGYTAMHYAVLAEQSEMIALLLKANASIDLIEPKQGRTPVHLALDLGREDLALQMIQAQFGPDQFRAFYLLHASQPGDFHKELETHPELLNVRVAGGWSLLHQAVADKNLDEMSYLLDQGFDSFARDCALRCALHYAAENGNLELVERLIEKKADPNVVDERKVTPLALAVAHNHLEVCKFLLGNQANPNIIDADGKNLAFALATCDQPMADLLASYPMDLNLRDSLGRTPLYGALNNPTRVAQMIKAGAQVNPKDKMGQTLLHAAADSGNVEVLKALLEAGIPLDTADNHKRTALHLALIKSHGAAANLLIGRGADLEAMDDTGNLPIHYAVYSTEALSALLKRHARFDAVNLKSQLTPAQVARVAKAADAQVLLQAYGDFFAAAKDGKLDALQAVFTDLNTARDAALKAGNQALAQALTETPASLIGARNNEGSTPLLVAAENGQTDLARYLFQCGADATVTRLDGRTALHLAAAGNHGAMLQLLLPKKADLGATDAAQQTALHRAAANNAVDAAKLLIAAKASLDAVDKAGHTPLQVAEAGKKEEVAAVLSAAAGK